jgi:hypothetical protein
MSRFPILVLCAFLALPGAAMSETEAAGETATLRPDDSEGTKPPSDGIAECASILAVASTQSQNRVQREAFANSAAEWFAISGDLALAEGALPEADLWSGKVAAWAGRIGSIDALSHHADWMAYCAQTGQQHGLGAALFAQTAP